jgi:hypothetical protein
MSPPEPSGSAVLSDSPGPSWSPLVVVAIADALPWRALLLDLLVVTAWVLAVSVAFRQADLPSWLYYVVALGGVVAYSLVDVPWPSVGGD